MFPLVKRAARGFFGMFGLAVHRVGFDPQGPAGVLHLWRRDPEFARIFEGMGSTTLVDEQRCFVLYQCARQARGLPGGAAEVGVYRGGTARLLGEALRGTRKSLHLFDTFSGMPATDAQRDIHREGDFADTSLEKVQERLQGIEGVHLHQGFFPQTATVVSKEEFCLVHVDADIYRSVFDACEFFYPRIVPGGMMVFDDYGFPSCPGARQAVDTFFATRAERPLYLPTGQCLVTRLGGRTRGPEQGKGPLEQP